VLRDKEPTVRLNELGWHFPFLYQEVSMASAMPIPAADAECGQAAARPKDIDEGWPRTRNSRHRREKRLKFGIASSDRNPDTASTAYDLACALAHSGRSDEAISVLREAIDRGLDPATDLAMSKDPDLKLLSKDPRFEALVSYAQQRAATQKANLDRIEV
jgi:pentatricopeptide repeat protein